MHVRFGNLTIEEFEKRTEVKFSDEDRKWLEEHRIDNAQGKENNRFHIFDMPLGIIAGFDIGDELVKRLKQYEFKKSFSVETKEAGETPTS